MLPTLSYWCFNPGLTMAQLALMKVSAAEEVGDGMPEGGRSNNQP